MTSLEHFPCFCKVKNLELFKSQSEEQYIRCKDRTCGFFTKATEFNEYMKNFTEKVLDEYKKDYPTCLHGKPATLFISKSEKNPNRGYFKCSVKDDKCDYFQWSDSTPNKNANKKNKPYCKYCKNNSSRKGRPMKKHEDKKTLNTI